MNTNAVFGLLNINSGLILFDDYRWREQIPGKSTKSGIDKFLSEFEGKYEIVKENYQILIRKI